FDGPARQPESLLTQREMDLARSVQDITEEVMLKMAAFARRETGMRDLCLAGGVALNCVGNGRIVREGIFDEIWIQPAAGDAGVARRLERAALAEEIAALMAQEKVVGLLQGRMEFGPRALGGRSIIGDPRSPRMQSMMNLKIKFRESFRPFAPAVLREQVGSSFELEGDSPYMLLV